MKTTHWTNVYNRQWAATVAKGMAKHPAKYSRALICKIVAHMVEQGYVQPGDTVCDPFGGVALGALPLIERGVNWVGVELEEHFVKLAQSNIDLWNSRYAWRTPNWGRATIYWGDSRHLLPVVARARFDAVLGSPPYAGVMRRDEYELRQERFARSSGREQDDTALDAIRGDGYGDTPGQLSEMDDGNFDAVLSSPPYEGSVMRGGDTQMAREKGAETGGYGKSAGQLGGKTGDMFWGASRMIVEACHDSLRPGGAAVWVVKDFARNWKLVPFAQRWLDLQIACGFEHIETIVASQVDNPGIVQQGLFGDAAPRSTRHGGLFRNLYEGKGGPVISSENVYILKKPLA